MEPSNNNLPPNPTPPHPLLVAYYFTVKLYSVRKDIENQYFMN